MRASQPQSSLTRLGIVIKRVGLSGHSLVVAAPVDKRMGVNGVFTKDIFDYSVSYHMEQGTLKKHTTLRIALR